MKITLLTVGKIRESWLREGVAEYSRRLSRFAQLEIREVLHERAPEGLSPKGMDLIKKKEGERLLAQWPSGAWEVILDANGKQWLSERWAAELEEQMQGGCSHFLFVVGGSLGLGKEVKNHAKKLVSLGPNTFPHQFFRVILLEQIYRAFKIIRGEPYHK